MNLILTPEQTQRVLRMVADDLSGSVDVRGATLFTVAQASKMLGLSEQACRRVIFEYVDFGERTQRVSLDHIQAIIKKRTIKLQRR